MNAELRRKAKKKNDFKKKIKSMNNAVFGKAMEKIIKNCQIKLVTTKKEEETVWCWNQIIILQIFLQKICCL